MHKHELLSEDIWKMITSLQSHREEHLTGDDAKLILWASEGAKINTGSDLSHDSILDLYCIVSRY